MQLRLYGKGEYIDKYNRLKIYYTDQSSRDKLKRYALKNGWGPITKNGFFINCKWATIDVDGIGKDINDLLGRDLTMLCDIKHYEYTKDDITKKGWTLYPTEIVAIIH